uniref:Uncharacterized protein n=1 Tax=Setaria italica TaxID=4555 RepID=K4AHF7_SETIT
MFDSGKPEAAQTEKCQQLKKKSFERSTEQSRRLYLQKTRDENINHFRKFETCSVYLKMNITSRMLLEQENLKLFYIPPTT